MIFSVSIQIDHLYLNTQKYDDKVCRGVFSENLSFKFDLCSEHDDGQCPTVCPAFTFYSILPLTGVRSCMECVLNVYVAH